MAVAIVVGSGRTVWSDLAACQAIAPAPVIFAVNDMTVFCPTVHHAVSHHPDLLAHWYAIRTHPEHRPHPRGPITTHASSAHPKIDRAWPQFHHERGSSSLLAVRVALALGHEQVVVAGVPLDAGGYVWGDPHAAGDYDFARYRRGWEQAQHELRGRVTAPSGYLRELLGWSGNSGGIIPTERTIQAPACHVEQQGLAAVR